MAEVEHLGDVLPLYVLNFEPSNSLVIDMIPL